MNQDNQILKTHKILCEGKLCGHWIYAAAQRLAAGEGEAEVMADYGYKLNMVQCIGRYFDRIGQ